MVVNSDFIPNIHSFLSCHPIMQRLGSKETTFPKLPLHLSEGELGSTDSMSCVRFGKGDCRKSHFPCLFSRGMYSQGDIQFCCSRILAAVKKREAAVV